MNVRTVLGIVAALIVCGHFAIAQPPSGRGGPEGGGPPGGGPRRGPPSPERFVEHAMSFDADGDGKLDRGELMKFAADIQAMRMRGGPGGGPGGPGGPEGFRGGRRGPPGGRSESGVPSDSGERPERPRRPD